MFVDYYHDEMSFLKNGENLGVIFTALLKSGMVLAVQFAPGHKCRILLERNRFHHTGVLTPFQADGCSDHYPIHALFMA